MNKIELEQLGIDINNLDLCSFLKFFSYDTWERIGFTRQYFGMRIYETTITQNLVYTLYSIAKNSHQPLKIFESSDEASNGNDLEIFIKTKEGYIKFACQCKIIYKNNRYVALNHQRKGSQQIDSLLNYSLKDKSIPIYMFYNHCSDSYVYSINNIKLYGCSILSAKYLKNNYYTSKWSIPHFADLHPHPAKPFSNFVCESIDKSLDSFEQTFGVNKLKTYSFEELIEDENWNDMTPPPVLGYLEVPKYFKESLITNEVSFNPKFRIVFSNELINNKTVIVRTIS